MERDERRWSRRQSDPGERAAPRRERQPVTAAGLAVALLAIAAAPALAQRQLSWRPLAVEARLDAAGGLWVRESHTMVFTGDWNGGERIFRLGSDQSLELLGLARLDPATGEPRPLARGSLSRVDHYEWVDRRTLRWRSRLPSDPAFDETAITYLLEYRQEGVLSPRGEGRYRLDHDFAFPDRRWPIELFTLELALDPVWRPTAQLEESHGPVELGHAGGYVVTVDLEYTGDGRPAAVRHPPPVAARMALFLLAGLAIVALIVRFFAREHRLGRFSPPPPLAGIDPGWLEEHLFDLLPEEAGALWDRRVGPPEVAAILARWEAEGRIASRVEPRPGLFRSDVMKLELLAARDSFEGYEGRLLEKLFFDGRRETDTEAIRERYRKTGFDPGATVRPGIERRLRRLGTKLAPHERLPGKGRRLTGMLFLAVLALLGVEAIGRPVPTLQLAGLLLVPLMGVYLVTGLVFAHVYRGYVERPGPWALGFLAPGVLFWLIMAGAAFFDRLLPAVDFAPQPGLAGSAALAVLAVMVWSSLLNHAACRERPAGLARRQRLAAARRLFAGQLGRARPELLDEWMPYLLALGLGPRVDRWWRRFGAAGEAGGVTAHRFGSASSGSGGSGGGWTGGGGAFGGAGATASWAAVAGSVAAGVARPGSGGSGGGGGGGGGSSGGGGGGGW